MADAARDGDEEVVRRMLDEGFDVNVDIKVLSAIWNVPNE